MTPEEILRQKRIQLGINEEDFRRKYYSQEDQLENQNDVGLINEIIQGAKGLGRDLIRTPVRLTQNIAAAGRILGGQSFEEATAPRYSRLLGEEITPIGTQDGGGLTWQNLKEATGAGLELSSFIPISRGVQAGFRGIVGAAAREGAVGAGFASAGQQLSETGTIDPIQVGIDTTFGGLLGGAFGTGVAGIRRVGRAGTEIKHSLGELLNEAQQKISAGEGVVGKNVRSVRNVLQDVEPSNLQEAQQSIKNAYQTAFVDDQIGINNQLTRLGRKVGKSTDELVDNLANEGFIPEVEGSLAKMENVFEQINERQKLIANEINATLSKYDDTTSLSSFASRVRSDIQQSGQISGADMTRTLDELDRIVDSFRVAYGETLTPSDVNRIRVEMNRRTRAYAGEIFQEDVSNAIARVARETIDEIVPDQAIRNANAEWGRLQELYDTARIFDNKRIYVGDLGKALGSYGALLAASAAGFSVAGPAGLFVAGLVSKRGGDYLVKILRNKKFSQKASDFIKRSLQEQPGVIDDLIKTAKTQSDKNFLRTQLALPSPSTPEIRTQIGSQGVIELPASIRETDLGLDEVKNMQIVGEIIDVLPKKEKTEAIRDILQSGFTSTQLVGIIGAGTALYATAKQVLSKEEMELLDEQLSVTENEV